MGKKWFTVCWYNMTDLAATGTEGRELFGPFDNDAGREAAIDNFIEENEDLVVGVVRFWVADDGVVEIEE